MNILVVEDEKNIAGLIKRGLESDGYNVVVSHNGADGLALANTRKFDLLILDWLLPKKDGLAVLYELRQTGSHMPVLMLTAKDQADNIVSGLDTGADDYLTKPFEFAELQARVRTLIRRANQDQGTEFRHLDVRIDPVNHKAWRGDAGITLSETEYRILAYFVRNAETVLSRQDIFDNCWNTPVNPFSNIVDVYINYLRKKVDEPFPTKFIHSVRGQGYIFEERK